MTVGLVRLDRLGTAGISDQPAKLKEVTQRFVRIIVRQWRHSGMLRFEGTGRRSVGALRSLESWRAIKCEVSDDFRGKRRGRWDGCELAVSVEGRLVVAGGERERSGSQAWDGGSMQCAGTGNLRLWQVRA